MQLNAYLSFNGQCEEAFKFYEACFGGKIEFIAPYAGTPMADSVPAAGQNRIMHATLRVGDHVLMGADAPPEGSGQYESPKGFSMSIHIDQPEEAERIFRALSDKGIVQMPLQETFWATRFGMAIDRFGIPWMINCGKSPS